MLNLGTNTVFGIFTGSIVLDVFDEFSGNVAAGDTFNTKSREAFTSRTSGPRPERIRSTPAIWSPIALAALTAMRCSSAVNLILVPSPPLWRLLRKSSSRDWRFILATTREPTTKARISVPADSFNVFLKKDVCAVFVVKVESLECRFSSFLVSASTTPLPWVPVASLMMTGSPIRSEKIVNIRSITANEGF